MAGNLENSMLLGVNVQLAGRLSVPCQSLSGAAAPRGRLHVTPPKGAKFWQ
jgi:hypothetical protein